MRKRIIAQAAILLLGVGSFLWALSFLRALYLTLRQDNLAGRQLELIFVIPTYLCYYFIITLTTMGLVLFLIKYTRVRVFISYQNKYFNVAEKVELILKKKGYRVILLPFKQREQDRTVAAVQDGLRRSDLILAVPGPDPSWMDHEISMASFAQKGIIIIKHLPNQRDFSTIYRGYPVFDWSRIEANELRNLIRFVDLSMYRPKPMLIGYIKAISQGFFAPIGMYLYVFVILPIEHPLLVFLISLLLAFIYLVLYLYNVDFSLLFASSIWALRITILMLPLALATPLLVFAAVNTWNRASDIIRQRFISGDLTTELLAAHCGDAYGLDDEVIGDLADGRETPTGIDL